MMAQRAVPHDLLTHGAIPPLESGARLTRPEFERRYDATPNLKNAELIEGVVYLRFTTPLSPARRAACPSRRLALDLLGSYPRREGWK
jgi:hypothetical protein